MTFDTELVDQLARLTDDGRRELAIAAGVERRRRIRDAVNEVRRSILPDASWRKAARKIADATRDRYTDSDTDQATRAAIKAILVDLLGTMEDVPDAERIRQLFG